MKNRGFFFPSTKEVQLKHVFQSRILINFNLKCKLNSISLLPLCGVTLEIHWPVKSDQWYSHKVIKTAKWESCVQQSKDSRKFWPEQGGKFHPSKKCYGIFSVTELTGCHWVTTHLVMLHLLADNVEFYLGIFSYFDLFSYIFLLSLGWHGFPWPTRLTWNSK